MDMKNVEIFNRYLLEILHHLFLSFPIETTIKIDEILNDDKILEPIKPHLKSRYAGPSCLFSDGMGLIGVEFYSHKTKSYKSLPDFDEIYCPDVGEIDPDLIKKLQVTPKYTNEQKKHGLFNFDDRDYSPFEENKEYLNTLRQIANQIIQKFDWTEVIEKIESELSRSMSDEELEKLKKTCTRPLYPQEIELLKAYEEDLESYKKSESDKSHKIKILQASMKFLVAEGFVRIHENKHKESAISQTADHLISYRFNAVNFVLTNKGLQLLNKNLSLNGFENESLGSRFLNWSSQRVPTFCSISDNLTSLMNNFNNV